MKKILKTIWSVISWLLILALALVGARCTQLGMTAMFGADPTHDELLASCKYAIAQGDYSSLTSSQRIDACLSDSYQSLGGAAPIGFIAAAFGLLMLFLGYKWFMRAIRAKAPSE